MSEKAKSNLVNYLVLPLLQLNESSFGGDNFINSYIGEECQVVVAVKDKKNVVFEYFKHESFLHDFDLEDRTIIIFTLPLEFTEDLSKFVDGKYSQYSKEAKEQITKFSGLPTGHYFFHVLNKTKALREQIERDLALKKGTIDPEQELHSKPSLFEFYSNL